MALINFSPLSLGTWVNDETKLNAANMNQLKDGVMSISETLLNSNGAGIVTEMNKFHDGMWGTSDSTGTPVTFGLWEYLENIIPQIYGRNDRIKFDKTNPENLIDDKYSAYVSGNHLVATEYKLPDNDDYNNVTSTNSAFDGKDTYSGLVGAAYHTQLYAEYTRMRLYALENRYRPDSVLFKTGASIKTLTETDNNRFVITAPNNYNLILNLNRSGKIAAIVNSKESVAITDTRVDIKVNEITLNSTIVDSNGNIIPPENNSKSLGTAEYSFNSAYVKKVWIEELNANKVTTNSLIATEDVDLQGTTTANSIIAQTTTIDKKLVVGQDANTFTITNGLLNGPEANIDTITAVDISSDNGTVNTLTSQYISGHELKGTVLPVVEVTDDGEAISTVDLGDNQKWFRHIYSENFTGSTFNAVYVRSNQLQTTSLVVSSEDDNIGTVTISEGTLSGPKAEFITSVTSKDVNALNAYIDNLYADNVNGFTLKGSVIPEGIVDLGTSSARMNAVYTTTLVAKDASMVSVEFDSATLVGEQKTEDNSIVKYETLTDVNLSLQEQIDSANENLQSVQSQVSSLETDVSNLSGSIEEEIKNRESDVQSITLAIDEIEGAITEIQSGSGIAVDSNQFEWADGQLSVKDFNSAVEGAQLVKSAGVVKWVKPDTTTVEGLDTAIKALEDRADAIEQRVTIIETTEIIIDEGSIDDTVS